MWFGVCGSEFREVTGRVHQVFPPVSAPEPGTLNPKPVSIMEMERAYYVVSFKPAYLELLREMASRLELASDEDEAIAQRMVVAITQGGFGQDVVDDKRQTKERFLEYLFFSSDLDLPRTDEVFDQYFEMELVDEFVDLDEEQ